jgi:hypothetical protein
MKEKKIKRRNKFKIQVNRVKYIQRGRQKGKKGASIVADPDPSGPDLFAKSGSVIFPIRSGSSFDYKC